MTHQYSRAERLLTRPFSIIPTTCAVPEPPMPNGSSIAVSAKGKSKEIPQFSSMPRLPMGPGGMIEVPEEMQESVSRLVDMSVACRYLAAQCQVRVDTSFNMHLMNSGSGSAG